MCLRTFLTFILRQINYTVRGQSEFTGHGFSECCRIPIQTIVELWILQSIVSQFVCSNVLLMLLNPSHEALITS